MATVEEIYKKKDLHEHILTRPDMYIGSSKKTKDCLFVFDEESKKIVKKDIEYVPGLIKIFDEILVNALDHSIRDDTMTQMKVTIDKDSGEISVANNGEGIPIVLHKEYNIYVPELIFGNLLTSSNYDDSKSRIVGGLNGLGANLTNIYSKSFKVETVQGGLHYSQTFSDNMFKKTEPKIKNSTKKTFTKITFTPDYSRFGIKGITEDIYSILIKRVYDAASSNNISVFLNNEKINIKDFKEYVKLYVDDEIFYDSGNKWEYCISYNPDTSYQVSFVNGISTTQGGKHVDYILKEITKKLLEKKKLEDVKPNYIKDRLSIFVKATIVNPSFSSQSKEYLSTSSKDFGFKPDITDAFVNKIYSKTNLVEDVLSFAKFKNLKELDKNIDANTKRKAKISVPGLEDAHNAGTSKSSQCTLFLTEGLSAKTFAMSGLSVIGRKDYGVMSLRGKLLNIREATQKQLVNNEEINNIKKIIGLSHGKKYKDVSTLRYGKVCILTDADYDGVHIKALVVNMFHVWFPELLDMPGFICYLKTPIIKISYKKEEKSFFTVSDYNKWLESNKDVKHTIKYYKGLGTSTAKEAREIFKEIPGNIVKYFTTPDTDEYIKLAFEKKKAENRKLWLRNYNFDLVLDQAVSDISYRDLVDKELIHFSMYDIIRSIPQLVDGLKPSQRKVLHTMFKRNFTKEIKVAQLGAAVAEMTSYHHGEASLYGTIVNMAQNYTGSNNINLLKPNGQFGTRTMLGKDAASPRYIFTELEDYTKKIFLPVDTNVLDYLEDDGQTIEPKFFVPVLPMVLVNGCQGIGTGYSTTIPSYNPKDIVENINLKLKGKNMKKMIPWYKGFKGKITEEDTGFTITGNISIKDLEVTINELPVTTSIDDYKEFLEKMYDTPQYGVSNFVNNSTESNPLFSIKLSKNSKILNMNREELLKLFKLTKNISTNNFHLLDQHGTITKYNSAEEILEKWIDVRLEYNQKRKDYLIEKFSQEKLLLSNRIRFLNDIIDEKIVIFKKSKKQVDDILEKNNYEKLIENNYNYLTEMAISSFTKEKVEALEAKLKIAEQSLKEIISSNPHSILEKDLEELKF